MVSHVGFSQDAFRSLSFLISNPSSKNPAMQEGEFKEGKQYFAEGCAISKQEESSVLISENREINNLATLRIRMEIIFSYNEYSTTDLGSLTLILILLINFW